MREELEEDRSCKRYLCIHLADSAAQAEMQLSCLSKGSVVHLNFSTHSLSFSAISYSRYALYILDQNLNVQFFRLIHTASTTSKTSIRRLHRNKPQLTITETSGWGRKELVVDI
jgi:hypothetical protein